MKRLLIPSLLCPILLAGCVQGGALTAKAKQQQVRYFSPEEATVRTTSAAVAPRDAPKIKLGHVRSSASLRSRIVHRDSAWEVGMYETLRWTDNPEVYVRRALSRALFDEGRATEASEGDVPTLDVEVIAFEIDRSRRPRAGRVELRWELRDDAHVIASGVASSEQPAEGEDVGALVAAIARAMGDSVETIARKSTAAR